MERLTYPRDSRERAEAIRSCAESCRDQCEILTPAKLAYLKNWTLRYAEYSIQWYAGLLNDARRGLR